MDESKCYRTNTLLSLICHCLILCCFSKLANSAVITVGVDNRWTDGTDYISWAQPLNFTVGDVLVFSYTKGKHNVYDVPKITYQSCDVSDGFNAVYDTGNDRVELKEAREYWFICTVDSHCKFGMKFGIKVTGSGNTTAAAPPPASASNRHITSSMFYMLLVGLAAWGFLLS